MDQKPAFYAIIPAHVRYAKINANAKLLYGEITALCNQEGFCFATNKYFADLYGVDDRTIRRWLNDLNTSEFIYMDYDRYESGKTIRKIYIATLSGHGGQNCPPPRTEMPAPPDNNAHHNNTLNTTINNKQKNNGLSANEINGDFLDEEVFSFGENLGLNRQAVTDQHAKWQEYILAYPDKAPSGDQVSAFKGWLRRTKKTTSKNSDTKPTGQAPTNKLWDLRIKDYQAKGFWINNWGDKPESDLCIAPIDILQQYGYRGAGVQ